MDGCPVWAWLDGSFGMEIMQGREGLAGGLVAVLDTGVTAIQFEPNLEVADGKVVVLHTCFGLKGMPENSTQVKRG